MGINLPPNIPPSHGTSGASGPNANIQNFVKSEGVSDILQGFGIKQENITQIVKQEGFHLQPLQVNQDQAQTLNALLGTSEVAMAYVASSLEEKERLKKRLKEIDDSIKVPLNDKQMAALAKLLGIKGDIEDFVMVDDQGGVLVVQTGLKSIEDELNANEEKRGG